MMKQFQDLFARLGLKRPKGRRIFPYEESLVIALVEQAKREQVPVEGLVADIMTTGLRQRKTGYMLKDSWESLTPREQEVTALTCRGYTNRQIAARLGIGEETAKTHVSNALRKFDLHGKAVLSNTLKEWDFSEWK